MLDQNFLDKKIELFSKYLDELEPLVKGFGIAELRNDNLKYHTIERLFQLIVDMMIDINIHILREGNIGAPDDLQSTFKMLGEHKVLESVFANKIAPIVGARNMIVHRYEKLDMDMFLSNLKNNFSDFKRYITEIHKFIRTSK